MTEKSNPEQRIKSLLEELGGEKKKNRALEEENERYRHIAESRRDLVSIHDDQARFVYVSPASLIILGYEPGELEGKDLFDFIHSEDYDLVKQNHQRNIAGQEDNSLLVYRMKHKNGSWIWLETLNRAFSPDRKRHHIIANSRDVTERLRLLHEIENSRQRYKSLVENLPFILFRFDSNLKLIYASPNVSGLLPFRVDEMKGCRFADLGFPE
ncbi:MAG TPA: PAS domain S-box protein, partial [Bacteroidales bacterium]|nr:PAS domain S-box protein [Bacteroidales bacterium]